MKKIFWAIGIILIAAIVTASAALFLFPYEPKQPPSADDTGSSTEGIQEVVDANNRFAFELYSKLNNKDTNMFYSPYSISSALAMTYEGAKGETAEEMKSVFHFPESNILRPNFAAVYNNINKASKAYELRTGNALWAQYDYRFLEDYTSRVEKYYGGRATNLDFVGETERSRQTINDFIEEQTNDRIKDLIPRGVLNAMTRLVLTNAIYFKGTWEWEFDKSDTRDQLFKITPENTVEVPMMYMKNDKAEFNYAELEKLQILELPYKGEEVSMLILLPKQGRAFDTETGESIGYDYALADIELSSENLNEWKARMHETKLDGIFLPKFEFDTKYFLNDALKAMGMPTAFSMKADFSGMDGTTDLFISDVIHQAFVKVDEKGTEAAAATAVVMKITGIAMPKLFRADHPFIFLIQEKATGNILFLGKVVDPTK